MTAPYGYPNAPQQAGRAPNGYVQMPGGYDDALNGVRQPAQQAPTPQQTLLGQPTPQAVQGPQYQDGSQSPLALTQPNLPWRQPQQQQQTQPTPQQVMGQPQPMQQAGIADLNARVSGANIPQELQGRTIGEIIGIANGLRQIHLQGQMRPTQAVVSPQQQAQAQQVAQAAAPDFDWKNPNDSIGRVVGAQLAQFKQEITPMLAPIVQQGMMSQAVNARNQVAAEIPNFAQLEPVILQRLQGIDAQSLLNPDTWRVAARWAIGEMQLRGQQPQPGQAPQPTGPWAQNGQPGLYPNQYVGAGQNPLPNLNGFYTEQPNQGGPVNGPVQLTAFQDQARIAMGLSKDEYLAWGAGVIGNGARR